MRSDAMTMDELELAYPPWSGSDELEAALRGLASASKRTGQAAYDRLRFAFGNPHSKTYWPAVLLAIPRLAELLDEGTEVARAHALYALIELVFWAGPEPGFETVATPRGPRRLASLVTEATSRLGPTVERLAAEPTASSKVWRLAAELRSYLDEQPPSAAGAA